jgi:hypothetical protein
MPRHEHGKDETLADEAMLHSLPSLLDAAIRTQGKEKVVHFLETYLARIAPEHSPFHVSREKLLQTHAYTDAELAQLSDTDFVDLSHRLEDSYRSEWFPQELIFHTEMLLENKRTYPTPPYYHTQ